MARLMGLLSRFFRYQPARAIAYKQGDPPPEHIARKCEVIFEGGAAKAPNIVQPDGTYSPARLQLSARKGYATDEHCWVWFKTSQLGHYDLADLKYDYPRSSVISQHIREMAKLNRPAPQRVDLINEPLHPHEDQYLKDHEALEDPVTAGELAHYFGVAQRYMPNVQFIVNEGGCERSRARAEDLIRLVDELQGFGVERLGVGLQCHLFGSDTLDVLDWVCARLVERGVPIYFTEIDIDDALESEQNALAKRLMQIVRRHKVKQICLWHWRDLNHWRPGAAPFDEHGEPKQWARTLGYA